MQLDIPHSSRLLMFEILIFRIYPYILNVLYHHVNGLFNLKFAAKELERNSKKCDKEEKVEKAGLKKAIEKGNMEASDSKIVLISR